VNQLLALHGSGGRGVDQSCGRPLIDALAAYEHHRIDLRAVTFTLYLGASYDDPVDGMFSFTPALPASDDGPRFARPPSDDRRFVNPASKQAPAGARVRRPISDVREAWEGAVQACRASDVDFAVRVALP